MFSISIAFVNTLCWTLSQPSSTTFPWRSHKNIPNIKTVGKFWRIDNMGCTLKHLHSVECLKHPVNRALSLFWKKNVWSWCQLWKHESEKHQVPWSMNLQKINKNFEVKRTFQNSSKTWISIFATTKKQTTLPFKKYVQRDVNGMCLKGLKLINGYIRSKKMNQLGILNNFSSINNVQQCIIQNRFRNCSRLYQAHLLLLNVQLREHGPYLCAACGTSDWRKTSTNVLRKKRSTSSVDFLP